MFIKMKSNFIMNNLKVSVLMAVYNGGQCLRSSIDSILNQTFTDFEFIIINDGSTDRSLEIINEYREKDERIILLNQVNTGLTKALNSGARFAKGRFIARQDADDISLPDRLEQQVSYMRKNPGTVVLGSKADIIKDEDLISAYSREKYKSFAVSVDISKQNHLPHSSVLFRKEIFKKCGGYNETFKVSQDFDLWNRMAAFGNIDILKNTLVLRRIESSGISRQYFFMQMRAAAKIRWKYRRINSIQTLFLIYWYAVRHIIVAFLFNDKDIRDFFDKKRIGEN